MYQQIFCFLRCLITAQRTSTGGQVVVQLLNDAVGMFVYFDNLVASLSAIQILATKQYLAIETARLNHISNN